MHVPVAVQDVLHRFDLHLGRWSLLPQSRRAKLLNGSGVAALIDVGANEGQYAREVRRAGYQGRIVSYEPIAETYETLAAATSGDADWTCRNIALGAESGTAEIKVFANSAFSSFMDATDLTAELQPGARVVGVETVAVETLDEAVARDVPVGPLAVKVDVQGFEREVLAGASEALTRTRYLELELSFVPTYERGPTLVEMLDLVYVQGFRLALVENLLIDKRTGAASQMNGVFLR